MVECNLVAEQDVLALARLAQLERGAAAHHVDAVVDEVEDRIGQSELARLVVDHRKKDHGEAFLHLRVLVELVKHNLRLDAALELDNNPHAVAVAFIAHIRDIVDDFLVHQLGNTLDQLRLVHLVWNFCDDDGLPAARDVFHAGAGAHQEASAAGAVGVADAALAVDEAAGREVRPLHVLQHGSETALRVVDQRDGCVHNLSQIVRRDVGRHADSDAVRTVDDEVGDARRQHRGFQRRLVVVRHEIDGFHIDIGEHLGGNLRHFRFGVPHRSRRVAVDGAEVSLPIHQRVAQRKRLRQAHHGVVDGGVAVRVVVAHHMADDLGALGVLFRGLEAHVVHAVQHAPVHGLQAVAHLGQRPADDHRHGIVEIRPAHLIFNID